MKGDHTTYHKGYVISYWGKDGLAVGSEDVWKHAELRASGAVLGAVIDSPLMLGRLMAILDDVYQRGKEAQQKEFKKVLGITS